MLSPEFHPRLLAISITMAQVPPLGKSLVDRIRAHRTRLAYNPEVLANAVNELRKDESLCDVVLVVDNERFPAHRNILASFSPFFKTMFLGKFVESNLMDVPINSVEAPAMKVIVEYAYTFDLTLITEDNVLPVLHAADLFQVSSLITHCLGVLYNLVKMETCLSIFVTADLLNKPMLKEKAFNYILQNFLEVYQTPDFVHLNTRHLMEIIDNDYTKVKNEDDILNAALRWLQFNEEERQSEFLKVLRKVRLAIVSPDRLQQVINDREAFKLSPDCLLELEKGLLLASKVHNTQVALSSLERRRTAQPGAQHFEVVVLFCTIAGKRVLRFISLKGDEIRKLYAPPVFSCVMAAICSYGDMYICDHNNDVRKTSIWRFDSTKDEWTEISVLSKTPSRVAFAESDGFLYVCRQHPCKDGIRSYIDQYEAATGSWTSFVPSRVTASRPFIVFLNGMLYFIAKHSVSATSSTVFRLDPRLETWTEVASLDSTDDLKEVCAFNRRIYVLVDGRERITVSPTVETLKVYCPSTNEWSTIKAPSGRGVIKLTVLGGYLTAFRIEKERLKETMRYCAAADIWQTSCPEVTNYLHAKVKRFAAPLYYRLV